MSDIRFNQWLHNSGTGGVSQVDGGHVGIGTTNPLIPVGAGVTAILNVGVVTANSYYGDGSNLSGIVGGGTSLSFNDNIGAYFGNSQDLKIYHDGNHSYIDDQGTGNLRLRSGTLEILNLAGNKTSAIFSSGGGQTLNFNNSQRFTTTNTGAVVTGILTSTGNLHTDNLYANSFLTVNNNTNVSVNLTSTSTSGSSRIFFGDPDSALVGRLTYTHDGDYMTFNTAYNERLRITSGGLVGINSTSPSHNLDIVSSSNPYLKLLRSGYNPVYFGNAAGEGVIETTGATFIKTGGSERLRITSSGQVNLGTSGALKAEINNSVSGHYFVSQCSDNNNGFEIYQQHGSTSSRNTLAVYDNRSGSKIDSLLIRGDGVKITRSRGSGYARTYEFNYNTGAPGGVQTVSLATVTNYSGTCSAVADVTYVGVYGTANDYIYTGHWICGVRRANSNSAWNQTAAEVAGNGSSATSSIDVYWSSGQLYARTVGPWMGWTVNVRVTILNGDITVNV